MKTRFFWLCLGLAFAITLAIVVGQRLSAEAMSVMVGVVAGVAASIPTSLIVVWFATRTLAANQPAPSYEPQQPEARVVVVPPPATTPVLHSAAAYMASGYSTVPQFTVSVPPPAFAPRQFTVIGGAELGAQEFEPRQEVIWPQ